MSIISNVSENEEFISEALADIRVAVAEIGNPKPHLGGSKWSSLQASEKFLKAFLVKKGQTVPFNHSLNTLALLCESIGLPKVSRSDLDKVQCSPGVRYDGSLVSLGDAISAYFSCLRICAHVGEQLDSNGRSTVVKGFRVAVT